MVAPVVPYPTLDIYENIRNVMIAADPDGFDVIASPLLRISEHIKNGLTNPLTAFESACIVSEPQLVINQIVGALWQYVPSFITFHDGMASTQLLRATWVANQTGAPWIPDWDAAFVDLLGPNFDPYVWVKKPVNKGRWRFAIVLASSLQTNEDVLTIMRPIVSEMIRPYVVLRGT